MKVRIGYGLGVQGIPGDGETYGRFIDDLERLDYDSIWFSERINGNAPDPAAAMAFAAGRTRNLKLGMSVMVLPGRNPVLVAKEMASIAMLSNGRLLPAFGLGVADPREHAGFGVQRNQRGSMFDESLGLMRRLWTEDDVEHSGTHYSCSGISLRPRPPKPLEVWLGGIGPKELERVGRLADGWLPSFMTPGEGPEKRRRVEEVADAHGRTIDPEHFGVLIAYSLDEAPSEAYLERIRQRRPDLDPAELFPVGIPALRRQIEQFLEGGFSKFVLIPARVPTDMTAELERLAQEILVLET